MNTFTTVVLVVLLVAPTSVSAQGWLEIQRCASGFSCVVPIPPPFPIVQPTPPPPTFLRPTTPMPFYTPPVYVVPAPQGGINPWIPLMAAPPPQGRSAVETWFLLQQLAARRP